MDMVMTKAVQSAATPVPGCQIFSNAYFPQSRLEGRRMGNDEDELGAALRACAAGDRAGLATIYRSEAARMVTIAHRILRRHDLADAESIERLQDEGADTLYTDLFDQLDTASRLRACLARLDGLRRKTVLMAYVSGYSHGEIAGRLKLPLGTAKAWIRRSLSALRECMA